ncbi:PTS sugar transporter subunit IIA [Kiritimatiella glycovorans]|uniref:EIIABC-Fru n=1 Tax=Kiritimatiella glycovorans TaxID=1307763 RepID=A0A0G3EIL1_9BACT|nr:PTS sugar transporter subunit IIA [Kiritimatiella glycovorans]AKJ65277.1 EIIABC-Fru [Kiritimatiella glycovorans]
MPHNIMTLEEVAEYLRVSERTVYDWAQKGVLPGGKLGTAWRFRRADIEDWVNRRLGSASEESAGSARRSGLGGVLTSERVIFPDADTKQGVLETLVEVLSTAPEIRDGDELEKAIFRREEMMSTGIGFEVGVPHVRIAGVSDLVMAVAVCPDGIPDYESLDGAPVRIVCMVAAHRDQHAGYIRTLGAISSVLKHGEARERICRAGSPEEVCRLLKGEG